MKELLFRKGNEKDFPVLATIISTTEAWSCFGISYNVALGLFEKMEDTIYVAEQNGEIVGFITLRINGVGNIGAYVRMVAVAEKFRGQGIGRQMIAYIGNLASQYIPNLFQICSVENVDAQKFYEKNGFEKIGIMKNLVGKAALRLLEQEGKKIGIKYLLASISSYNEQSLYFHKKNGFIECGRFINIAKKKEINFDVVWMEKEIV